MRIAPIGCFNMSFCDQMLARVLIEVRLCTPPDRNFDRKELLPITLMIADPVI
jgi:hypothetical protein